MNFAILDVKEAMYRFLDNISKKTPKDVVRKLLYETLKNSFEEVDAQFNELCKLFYTEIIDVKRTKSALEELLDTLLNIGENMSEYTNQQMEVIGLDKDCDIEFIHEKLVNYQLITNELKGGIIDGRNNTIRFTPDAGRRNILVPKYEKFLSLADEIEEVLQILYESYLKLHDTIRSNKSEQVLNRFNKQFKNVKDHLQTESSLGSKDLLERLLSFCEVRKQPVSKKLYNLFNDCGGLELFISKAVEESIGDAFYSVYDKPLELARTIQDKQLDNTQVNELLMAVALTGMLSEKQHGVNYLFSRPRGRPPRDLCYEDCIEPLKEIVKDIQKRFTPKVKRANRKLFFNWSVAIVVSLLQQYGDKFLGCISAFYRFFEQIGCKIPYGLRYFQKRVQQFCSYLDEKSKGGYYDIFDERPTKAWSRKLRIFAPLEKIQHIIIDKFIPLKLV